MLENLQQLFLERVKTEGVAINLYLINGFQMKGILREFDRETMIVECEGKQELVYQHAVATVVPVKAINTMENENGK